jgi:hypothetical protein
MKKAFTATSKGQLDGFSEYASRAANKFKKGLMAAI